MLKESISVMRTATGTRPTTPDRELPSRASLRILCGILLSLRRHSDFGCVTRRAAGWTSGVARIRRLWMLEALCGEVCSQFTVGGRDRHGWGGTAASRRRAEARRWRFWRWFWCGDRLVEVARGVGHALTDEGQLQLRKEARGNS